MKVEHADAHEHPIIWLTGQSGAGKTTLGEIVSARIGAVFLDGDEMRESISLGATMSREDRIEHNHRVARLARVLSQRMPVVVAVIAPYAALRREIDLLAQPLWVYVKRELPVTEDRPYEEPETPDFIADSDAASPQENAEALLEFVRAHEK